MLEEPNLVYLSNCDAMMNETFGAQCCQCDTVIEWYVTALSILLPLMLLDTPGVGSPTFSHFIIG